MFKFKFTYVALAAALSSSIVYADPTTYTHTSGVKVIDIEKPNSAGVSHNMYREFNVESRSGVILNNSPDNLAHDTLGNIAKNNNLTNGSASVILNEVVSNKPSALNGFIEVAGQKADVIIANPNGITCSGCSFVNTNKAVLTTGKANLTSSGAIESYTITQGRVTIGEDGMSAPNAYTALLADTIAINGTLSASTAVVGAGNFTFNNSTGEMTGTNKTATGNNVLSIDVREFGGIKANSISISGTNQGFGVRNKGNIAANAVLTMTSNGELINNGTIRNAGFYTALGMAGNFENSGNITTAGATLIDGRYHIINNGNITSDTQLAVSAYGSIQNTGTIYGKKSLSAMAGGNLYTTYGSGLWSNNALTITVLNNINHEGGIQASNTKIDFGGSTLAVTGHIISTNDLNIRSWKDKAYGSGTLYNQGNISGNNVSILTYGDLNQYAGGNLKAKNLLSIYNNSVTNVGYIEASQIYVDNHKLSNGGQIVGGDTKINSYSIYNEGRILANSDMVLNTDKVGDITNRGYIGAGRSITMTANKINNDGYKCGLLNSQTCGKGTLSSTSITANIK
ncbi:filamentous hemagglutinin N-terminal domain-containing protein [Klebsiella spallanzanii]|uniref:two-partner secretion domain-containing protein n=1 Tax=Klebsiella spallanzanii TaxID=2587528 RepID=UPI001118A21D|nr:filamentous hemagglutinin N-terminal domain-containing protein [Klebsiella spallanzanii]